MSTLEQPTTKSRGILFSAPMVRAILEGRKSMTRRIVKPQSLFDGKDEIVRRYPRQDGCPYGKPGDLLYVKEAWACANGDPKTRDYVLYRADCPDDRGAMDASAAVIGLHWRSPIHMPREASRIWLRITDIRVERVQDISKRDIVAEGWPGYERGKGDQRFNERDYINAIGDGDDECVEWYAELWDQINGRGSWDSNPWVFAISFERIAKPEGGAA